MGAELSGAGSQEFTAQGDFENMYPNSLTLLQMQVGYGNLGVFGTLITKVSTKDHRTTSRKG